MPVYLRPYTADRSAAEALVTFPSSAQAAIDLLDDAGDHAQFTESITIPSSAPYAIVAPQPRPNTTITVTVNAAARTRVYGTTAASGEYAIDLESGRITFNAADAGGTAQVIMTPRVSVLTQADAHLFLARLRALEQAFLGALAADLDIDGDIDCDNLTASVDVSAGGDISATSGTVSALDLSATQTITLGTLPSSTTEIGNGSGSTIRLGADVSVIVSALGIFRFTNATTLGNAIQIGSDVHIYRSGTNAATSPDSFTVGGLTTAGTVAAATVTTTGNVTATGNVSGVDLTGSGAVSGNSGTFDSLDVTGAATIDDGLTVTAGDVDITDNLIVGGDLDLTGEFSAPNQPRCDIYNSAAQTVANATVVSLTFDSEYEDAAGLHSTSVNTDRVTVLEDGLYLVKFFTRIAQNATGDRAAWIAKNDEVTTGSHRRWAYQFTEHITLVNDYCRLTGCDLIRLSAGDYVGVKVYQSSGGNLDFGSGAYAERSTLTVTKVA